MKDRFNSFQKTIIETIDKLIHRIQSMEEETRVMNEKITEMQTNVSESDQGKREYSRKPNRSSESDEEPPRKRKLAIIQVQMKKIMK
jgi:hypothetical protein